VLDLLHWDPFDFVYDTVVTVYMYSPSVIKLLCRVVDSTRRFVYPDLFVTRRSIVPGVLKER